MSPKRASLLLLPALAVSVAACAPGSFETPDLDAFEAAADSACGGTCITHSAPDTLTYDELVALSTLSGRREGERYRLYNADGALENKLDRLLATPFVSNEAFRAGARPHRGERAGLGPVLRAAEWNIERGQELPLIQDAFRAAADPDARDDFFATRARPDLAADPGKRAAVDSELDALAGLDLVILNEVDKGMKRSGYADVVSELAHTLDMNYAYGVEFVEVDPIALGREQFTREDFLTADGNTGYPIDDGSIPEDELSTLAGEATALTAVTPAQVKNLHGNAILSRYPIVSAKTVPLTTTDGCWDWNKNEKIAKDMAGKGMDLLAEKVFLEKVMREIRHGGRTMLVVDLFVPGLNAKGTTMEHVDGERPDVVTVVDVHLEAKSTPKCRAAEMREVLSRLRDIKNPVVLAGDLNSLGTDGRPMTIERLLFARFHDPEWIAKQILGRLVPYSGWAFTMRDVFNWVRLKDDPTGIDIPFLLPNAERGLFDAVEGFSFADGGRFDFRGDTSRTVNETAKTLANSNQRDAKGFKTTFGFARTLGIGDVAIFGRFKIDWMFVRGYARAPRDGKASYRFAPHFPQTLEALRDATSPRLSDHAPMTVDLPLYDPCKEGACPSDPVGPLEFGGLDWDDEYTE